MKIEKGTSAVLKLYRFFKVRFSQFLLAQKWIRLKCRTQAQTVTERSTQTLHLRLDLLIKLYSSGVTLTAGLLCIGWF